MLSLGMRTLLTLKLLIGLRIYRLVSLVAMLSSWSVLGLVIRLVTLCTRLAGARKFLEPLWLRRWSLSGIS